MKAQQISWKTFFFSSFFPPKINFLQIFGRSHSPIYWDILKLHAQYCFIQKSFMHNVYYVIFLTMRAISELEATSYVTEKVLKWLLWIDVRTGGEELSICSFVLRRDYSSTIWLVNAAIWFVTRCHVSKQIYDSSPPEWTSIYRKKNLWSHKFKPFSSYQ